MRLTVIDGGASRTVAAGAARSGYEDRLEAAYAHYLAKKVGDGRAERTLDFYREQLTPFLAFLRERGIGSMEEATVDDRRAYMALRRQQTRPDGAPLQPETLHAAHRAIRGFVRWLDRDGYQIDPRLLREEGPRVPDKEMTVYHLDQVGEILRACRAPGEELVVRILVGAGFRRQELCRFGLVAKNGTPLIEPSVLDPDQKALVVQPGLEGGAKGGKGRRVPICTTLDGLIHRYIARQRGSSGHRELLLNQDSKPYQLGALDSLMDRLQARVGFRVHCHALRHTWCTAMVQAGWNLELLRAWAGHEEYSTLQGYIRLAAQRNLGSRDKWAEFIVVPR